MNASRQEIVKTVQSKTRHVAWVNPEGVTLYCHHDDVIECFPKKDASALADDPDVLIVHGTTGMATLNTLLEVCQDDVCKFDDKTFDSLWLEIAQRVRLGKTLRVNRYGVAAADK
jgi:hypothetical protein